METKTEAKSMPKWLIYGLFILKFFLGLYLIYWTVYMTLSSDVGADNDNAFLSDYHSVDDNFNQIVMENHKFSVKYNIKFDLNGQEIIGLSYHDIFLPQRSVQERKIRKNILNVGENNFNVLVQDKSGKIIKDAKITMLVTKATNHTQDVHLNFKDTSKEKFQIKSIGYWNITGTVTVGDNIGRFYIKTNASK